jgi:penicillin-binding protein 1A
MRKKNAGALFMDFQISPDDRVGATPKKGARTSRSAPGKAARGARVEPGFDDSAVYVDDERAPRGKQPRGRGKAPTAKKTRGRREKKPLTLFGVIWKLISWLFILGIWVGVAAAGVIIYYAVQLPSSETWKVPDRAANIRIVAANGQLISNRGKTGGEAVSRGGLAD